MPVTGGLFFDGDKDGLNNVTLECVVNAAWSGFFGADVALFGFLLLTKRRPPSQWPLSVFVNNSLVCFALFGGQMFHGPEDGALAYGWHAQIQGRDNTIGASTGGIEIYESSFRSGIFIQALNRENKYADYITGAISDQNMAVMKT